MSSVVASGVLNLYPRSPIIKAIRSMCSNVHNKTIYLHWIKTHVEIFGNEVADALAGAAVELGIDCPVKLPPSQIKKILRNGLLQNWQREWETLDKGRSVFKIFKNVSNKLIFKNPVFINFITGHGSFPSLLFKIVKKDNSNCVCGREGFPEHFLTTPCSYIKPTLK
ncbi:hypothetical protein JTE90_011094 [Oedothorax gibbosus]|uniref:RNase H type-1 domain-containing protein n=1 Tax=Oedothorax gibbosus TaxID=931172 RepID=A0AAV6TVU4_9ARAC|nr:hypothetical protein JTE90_011094 [Oedothorax gibbosus]